MPSPALPGLVAESQILNRMYTLRDQKIILDSDRTEMYGVETKQLKRQVKRNAERFPEDFMFSLTRTLEEPKWHLKLERNPLYAHGLYGTGCSYVIQRTGQQNGY